RRPVRPGERQHDRGAAQREQLQPGGERARGIQALARGEAEGGAAVSGGLGQARHHGQEPGEHRHPGDAEVDGGRHAPRGGVEHEHEEGADGGRQDRAEDGEVERERHGPPPAAGPNSRATAGSVSSRRATGYTPSATTAARSTPTTTAVLPRTSAMTGAVRSPDQTSRSTLAA